MTDALFPPIDDATAAPLGQWRLAEVQLANWGTFDGAIYRIPIARKSHLVTGPSGSGKSSLLDAIAAVLTPDKWLRFNQAAQGAGTRGDQRSLVSYVRGAWSRTTDENEDRVVSALLRPRATWSGIVLRYENDVDAPVSLCRLFFLRGTAMSGADVSDLCLIDRSAVDLRDLEPFARGGIETRRVQTHWPDAIVTTSGSHARFYARVRTLFGIANETALQLLHKTQSTKSLDSLDQLFRDYMLERPATFDLADTAVTQFGELSDAHDHVVQLRQQRDHLAGLREASDAFDESNGRAQRARSLAELVPPYQKRRSLDLAHTEVAASAERVIVLGADEQHTAAEYDRAEDADAFAQRRALELGGGDVEQLRQRMRQATDAASATDARWDALGRQLQGAGIARTPEDAVEFAELMAEIDHILQQEQLAPAPTHDQNERYFSSAATVKRIEAEIDAIRVSGSTVPVVLLEARSALASALSIPVSALPFAAELIEVRPEHSAWTGAIERVLRPLALTMLVRSEQLPGVRRWVDSHRIRARLVFEEVVANVAPPRPSATSLSLVNRVAVAPGPFSDWVASVLSDRFDVACVENPDDLDDHVRAVTIRGQVKSSRTRYEKDDRRELDDRSQWVLGDRHAKLEALIERLREASAKRTEAKAILDAIATRRDAAVERKGALRAVREQAWQDVDRAAARDAVAALARQLDELTRTDGDLKAAVAAAETTRAERVAAAAALEDARLALRQERGRHDELSRTIDEIESAIAAGAVREVDEDATSALDSMFRSIQRGLSRQNIAEVGQEVTQQLQREGDAALSVATEASNRVAELAAQFKERWPVAAADLSPSIADRRAYLELLDGIVAHGLPEHEANFLKLLRDRSRDLIGELVSDILGAPREIEDRVRPVNASLRRSRFDEDRYLNLRVKTRRTDTVTRFIADLRSISEGGWGDEDLGNAERRFATLAELMKRFASSEHADRTWKNQCLDTRLHVAFLAEEVDEHGRAHATYDSGAAMSGGQQQKLVVFCLAAALRYQLADPEEAFSRYGTIVLDEAFDKADTRYTRMALDVFVEFGFHLVLATPQKLLQTIEPYVGAATAIENPTRRRSEVANVPWRDEPV